MAKATLNTKNWDKLLKKTRGRISRRAVLLKKAYAIVGFKDVIDHFKNEQGPRNRWKRRDKKTNERYDQIRSGRFKRKGKSVKYAVPKGFPRAAFRSSNKILQLTGNMRQQTFPRSSRLAGKEAILVFNNAKYSGRHNRGDGDTPKRQFLWLSDKAKRLMLKIIVADIFK